MLRSLMNDDCWFHRQCRTGSGRDSARDRPDCRSERSPQHAVVSELNDVADAVGEINQSYSYSGFHKAKSFGGALCCCDYGSDFEDQRDDCDNNQCDIACDVAQNETRKTR